MDLENITMSENRDIIYDKLSNTIEHSNDLLHKKAVALIKGLKEGFTSEKYNGLEGVKLYTKNLLDLMESVFTKLTGKVDENTAEEMIKNSEALMLCLAICINQLPSSIIRKITRRVIVLLDNYLKMNKFEIKKFGIMILEKILFSRTEEELGDADDETVKFFFDAFIPMIEERSDEIHRILLKTLAKILRSSKMLQNLKMTLIPRLKNYLLLKIRGMCSVKERKDNDVTGVKIKSVFSQEGEYILKFLCSILQFLPAEVITDFIIEINQLINVSDDKHILLNCLLTLEMAFKIKTFSTETCEKSIKALLVKDFLINNENDLGRVDNSIDDIDTSLTIAHIKTISQALHCVSKNDAITSFKYLPTLLSLFGEFFTSNNVFLKNSLFNSLNTLMSSLLVKKNIDNALANNTTIVTDDINFEITLDNDHFNFNVVVEKTAACLLYLTSDRFDDVKPAFNLLLTLFEKISKYEALMPIVENTLYRLSERNSIQVGITFKIFLGKCFNLIKSSIITKFFPLQILDYDICSEKYTEDSRVWLISYIDKFLKPTNDIQTLKEFFESFYLTIEDLEKLLRRYRQSESNDMEVDDEMEKDLDERFQIEEESAHLKNIKIKRFELILTQIWHLCSKYLNYDSNYSAYVGELLKKYVVLVKTFGPIKELIFKCISKIIKIAIDHKDTETIENCIKKEGKQFFQQCLNEMLNSKLSNNELREGFVMVRSFCAVFSDKFLSKIICDQVERFDKSIFEDLAANDNKSNNSNKAKLNESLSFVGKPIKLETKKVNNLCMRLEIINLILRFLNEKNKEDNSLFELLNTFFEKFFFNDKLGNNLIKKKLMDLFMLLLERGKEGEKILSIFNRFVNDYKGLDYSSSKQKAKLFEFVLEILIKHFSSQEKLDAEVIQSQFHILVEIINLTKDMNRKVRNIAYEMIGKVTDFMSESGLFNDWTKIVLAILASNSSFLKSASVNALARIFWQKRHDQDGNFTTVLLETAEVVLLLFKENNKEISKSIFLFIRVLLYLVDNSSTNLLTQISYYIFTVCSEQVKGEFKVKLRNLYKNLIMKYSIEEVRKSVPKDQENLVNYINKHIVKKIKTMSKEDEAVYGNVTLNNSVMMDNDENLLDEEEEYIEKEFKKVENKKNDDEKLLNNINKFNIDEDDPEVMNQRNNWNENKNEKLDKIDQLFLKDHIELENFFYINPYANQTVKKTATEETVKDPEDVYFDKRRNKLIVKDLEKQVIKRTKTPKQEQPEVDVREVKKDDLLKKKRKVHNVAKDKDEPGSDDEDVRNSKLAKRKINDRTAVTVETKRSKMKDKHLVKFSGDEYKNQAGKGDKLIQGKFEPFAYIQLNPKVTSQRNRKEAIKVFDNIMNPKHK